MSWHGLACIELFSTLSCSNNLSNAMQGVSRRRLHLLKAGSPGSQFCVIEHAGKRVFHECIRASDLGFSSNACALNAHARIGGV